MFAGHCHAATLDDLPQGLADADFLFVGETEVFEEL